MVNESFLQDFASDMGMNGCEPCGSAGLTGRCLTPELDSERNPPRYPGMKNIFWLMMAAWQRLLVAVALVAAIFLLVWWAW